LAFWLALLANWLALSDAWLALSAFWLALSDAWLALSAFWLALSAIWFGGAQIETKSELFSCMERFTNLFQRYFSKMCLHFLNYVKTLVLEE
jgi:hypothetical protein